MKIFIFDLDDTIIYYPFGIVEYNNIRVDKYLSRILNLLNSPKFIYSNGTSKKNAEQSAASILLKNLDLQ